ncbi:g6784 [Coccomyxa viridis]|uniref:G6784 protein n=1 Tax=Coccomyxa viridis TaxID=1274662 RepID=A0ABP1FW84_9CHLO
MTSAADVEQKLRDKLKAADVTVIDTSGGCGASFDVAVVSDQFEGKRLLDRHRMINTALEEEMKSIHALSIRQCWTPEQQKAKQPS